MGKKRSSYYLSLEELADLSRRSAQLFRRALGKSASQAPTDAAREAEALAVRAGELRGALTSRLLREFVPPMDREDLLELIQGLEELSHLLALCCVPLRTSADPGLTLPLAADRLERSCGLLGEAVARLGEKDLSPLLERTAAVGAVTREGERLAAQGLLRQPRDPNLRQVYRMVGNVLAAVRRVADGVERAAVKN